ncbi:MAG: hypothetical protein ACR2PG_19955 [Hyphomicrobiaceae bacterium]
MTASDNPGIRNTATEPTCLAVLRFQPANSDMWSVDPLMNVIISKLSRALLIGLAAGSVLHIGEIRKSRADTFTPPQIFVLGDSQLAFGAGPAFYKFFKTFNKSCGDISYSSDIVETINKMRVGVMGVRSTSIHSWVSRRWKLKKFICKPDPKWNVNARLYGWPKRRDGTYVQLGRASGFRICKSNKSALEVMFANPNLHPKLLLLFFTGNSVHRWAQQRSRTESDIKRLAAQIPGSTTCVVMTTVPSYRRKDNRLREKAQSGVAEALSKYAPHCTFLPGYTQRTIKEFEGNRRYYRKHKSGRVKDPYHPNNDGARKFLALNRKALCKTVIDGFSPSS